MRCVLAIDAASINPQVKIAEDGTITGFTESGPSSVDPQFAKRLRKDPKEYRRFIKENLAYVAKYEFVVLLCPLDPAQPSFPISSCESNSGSATKEIKEALDTLRANAEQCGFDVVGYAFDGDRQYLDLTEDIVNEDTLEHIWERFTEDPNCSLPDLWAEEDFLFLFFDLLHLVKCDRYRKSKPKETCVWPTSEEASISPDLFQELGLPEDCFDDSKALKMHDDIPLKLFTPENCHYLFNEGKFDLCMSLLPSTYIIEAVFNEKISREQRLCYLTIGFCIMTLYYDDAIKRMSDEQDSRDTQGIAYSLFNLDYAKKYISLAWSLSHYMIDFKTIRLGSLGTHMLEHFFGSNRRMNNGNDTASNFMRTLQFQLLSSIIQKEMNVEFKQKKRLSSSGAILAKIDQPIHKMTLEEGYTVAAQLIRMTSVGNNFGCDEVRAYFESRDETTVDYEFIKDYLPSVFEKQTEIVPSLKSIRVTKVGGLANMSRYAMHEQVDKI